MEENENTQLRKEIERLTGLLHIVVARNEQLEQDLFACLQTISNLMPLFSSLYDNAETLTRHISSLVQITDRHKTNFSTHDKTADSRKINFSPCHQPTDNSKINFSSYHQSVVGSKINFSSIPQPMDSSKKSFSSYDENGDDSKINFSSGDEFKNDSKINFTASAENGNSEKFFLQASQNREEQKINFYDSLKNGNENKINFRIPTEQGDEEKKFLQVSQTQEWIKKIELSATQCNENGKNETPAGSVSRKGTVSPFSTQPIWFHETETIDYFSLVKAMRAIIPKSSQEGTQNAAIVLIRLYKSAKQSLESLSDYTDLSISGITKRIASMKKHGLITRAPGRGLVLTAKGIQMVESCRK